MLRMLCDRRGELSRARNQAESGPGWRAGSKTMEPPAPP